MKKIIYRILRWLNMRDRSGCDPLSGMSPHQQADLPPWHESRNRNDCALSDPCFGCD